MRREGKTKDFIISRTGTDADWAQWIGRVLEDAGYPVVIQDWDFRPGGNFVVDMHRGLQDAERVIAVLSQQYLAESPYGQPEWAEAFRQDPTGEKGILVPVKVRPCEPDGLLGARTFIDLVGLDERTAEARLLDGVKEGRRKPDRRPQFPGKPRPAFPGSQSVLGRLPRRNPNFSGREGLLSALRERLTKGRATALTAIHGLGGVGKTQVAVEYAYRHAVDRSDHGHVLWVRAEEPAQLASDYASLALQLGLAEREVQDQTAMVEAVRGWLETNGGWLLVFDNAPDGASVRRYLPRTGGGHVLITSRHTGWSGTAESLRVDLFTPQESLDFLRKRIGAQGREASELREELGDLPLALEQAAAYMDAAGVGVGDYLRLFRERREELWRYQPPPEGYDKTVGTTWSLSVEAAEKQEPLSVHALNLCAFFAPDDIPRSLLSAAGGRLEGTGKELADELALNRAVAALHSASLVTLGEDAVSLHRLVQAVARDCLGQDGQKQYAAAACEAVSAAYPYDSDDVRTWEHCARLLPQALAAAAHAESAHVAAAACSLVLSQCGLYLMARAAFDKAEGVNRRALVIAEEAHGPGHPTTATRLNNLAGVLRELGNLAGAKELVERALAIDQRHYGPDHPAVAGRLNNLGGLLQDLGDLQTAKESFERALATCESAYGPDHPEVASILSNLAAALHDLGDLRRAKQLSERALAIDEKTYGLGHPALCAPLNNLASTLRDLGKLQEAKEGFARAIAISETAYGPDHPSVAAGLNNLSSVLAGLQDYRGAKACLERALAIAEKTYGPDHSHVARCLNNLASVFGELGDLEGAKERFERALAIAEKAYGPDHPEVAILLDNLAEVLLGLGDPKGAKERLERALAILRKFLGDEHPKTQTVRRNLEALGG